MIPLFVGVVLLAAFTQASYAPVFTAPHERQDAIISALCRGAGDPESPPPIRQYRGKRSLLSEGGDARALIVKQDGSAILYCVNKSFRAYWRREKL